MSGRRRSRRERVGPPARAASSSRPSRKVTENPAPAAAAFPAGAAGAAGADGASGPLWLALFDASVSVGAMAGCDQGATAPGRMNPRAGADAVSAASEFRDAVGLGPTAVVLAVGGAATGLTESTEPSGLEV